MPLYRNAAEFHLNWLSKDTKVSFAKLTPANHFQIQKYIFCMLKGN